MKQIIILAWRNIWRSKRRTLITISSVFFSLLFAVLMRSFQLGSYNYFIFQAIESYTGFLQIQHPDYFYDPQIDNAFFIDSSLISMLDKDPAIKSYTCRINAFAMVSSGENTKGALISAIDPVKEKAFSDFEHRILHYRLEGKKLDSVFESKPFPEELKTKIKKFYGYAFTSADRILSDLKIDTTEQKEFLAEIFKNSQIEGTTLLPGDSGIMVSERLARFLKVEAGDTLILMAPGYHGTSANGLFKVMAIIKMPTIELDNKLIFMTRKTAEGFFGMDNMATSLAINLKNNNEMVATQKQLSNKLSADNYSVRNWYELNKTLKQQIEGDNASGIMFLVILYMIVFFGIFGTVLMMVMERRRQFAVLISIGMSRLKLWLVLLFELLIIGVIAIAAGLGSTIPIILVGIEHPIRLTGDMALAMEDMGFDPLMPMAGFDAYFFNQAIIVLIMVLLTSLIPLINIRRLKIINALKA